VANISISRRFPVDAAPERVVSYLQTPALLVHCLPGAELTSSSDDGATHEGTVTVKLGAISVSYRGTATFEDVDVAAGRLRVRAKAREKTGAGSAEMTVEMEVVGRDDGGSEVALDAGASVSGRIVTFGRGMIEIVSEQVLTEFVTCLCSMLGGTAATERAQPEAGATPPDGPGDVTVAGGPDPGAPQGIAPPTAARPASALGIFWRAILSWLRRRLGGA